MPQVKLISPITRQEIRKIRVAGYLPIQRISRTPTPTRFGYIPASFREKKSGSWWRYSLTKGSLA